MKHSFEKIAIVARGEAPVRLIRAIRELNHEQHLGLAAVALFTEPDRQAICVREAGDAVCIGPQQYRVTMSGQSIEVLVERLGAVEQRLDPSSRHTLT
jgi:acetyl/propionyl-CoA carboxylase alpha subunit